jgi:hypothetical protein
MRTVLFAAIASLALILVGIASAEVVQKGSVRVKLDGGVAPRRLPRDHPAPVAVSVATSIAPTRNGAQPKLTQIKIEINRYGRLDATGLPVCELDDIQPATTQKALQACRGSLVGEGRFAAQIAVGSQASFPSTAKMHAFSGRYHGKPAILAHVYGEDPVPTSFTLPFVISHRGGPYGTVLTASIPAQGGNFVTALSLRLSRVYGFRGASRSYATASCAAPRGLRLATFKFARVSYRFADGKRISSVLVRTCQVAGGR